MTMLEIETTVEVDGLTVPVTGKIEEQFQGLLDALIENYRQDKELGSAVSVVVDGREVVDLWSGWTHTSRTSTWHENTLVCMMSVAKGISAMAFNMLLDRGIVELDAPVASYWPEFAANGKQDLPVRYILDHRAGLPALADPLWPGAMYDRERMVEALAQQAPLWEPGTVAAYHVHTQGYLLGEIMRRTTGKLIGEWVRDEIAGPLGADYWLGLPDSEHYRVTDLVPNMGATILAAQNTEPEDSLRRRAFAQNPAGTWGEMVNSVEWRRMDMSSGSGHGNARSVARIYGAVANGELDGVQLLSDEAVERMRTMQHDQIELLQNRHYRQGLGVLLNSPDAVYMGPNPQAFGHHGIGGSIGFADREQRLGFSYSPNQMHSVGTNGPRAKRLIDAVYDVLQ